MSKEMTLDEAKVIGAELERGINKHGGMYSPPYSSIELREAVIVLAKYGNFDGPTKEDLAKANRQAAAANARYEKCKQGRERAGQWPKEPMDTDT